jgi:anti-sigma factor RsiW
MSDQRSITCQELTEVVGDYLEGVMPAEDRERFDAHLAICDGCVHYLTQMRQTVAATHALRREDVEATAPDELLSAFRAWQRGEPLPDA